MMLVVLLPAYNEADSMRPLLRSLGEVFLGLDVPSTVLLVDDGSSDDTVERATDAAREFGVKIEVEPHGRNRGLGAALRTGFERAN